MTSHDSGGDGDDDAQLKSLRAVWLSMPDEDPPERGLAELMAAARVKAEQMAKPSLWQRLAALLRRPPVLALATVLVLIGGAVFIGQRHSKMEVAPEASDQRARMNAESATSSAASGSAAMGPANTLAAPEAPAGAAESAPADMESAQPTPAVEAKPEPKKHEAPKIEAPPRVTHRPPPSSAGVKTATTGAPTTKMNDSVMEKSALSTDSKETKKSDSRGFDGTNGLIEGTLDENQSTDKSSPPPPAAPAEAPTADDRAGGTKGAATAQPQPEVRRAQQYIAQAKTAAARGDCAAARTLMKRVASEDAASYRKAIANDAALKKCFE
ncbi:MAG TPA: hypothetical protein VFV99_24910 [Kofleriaceae bacterium]|nr:hypothetical protein [Kofleriaceae bacterium]